MQRYVVIENTPGYMPEDCEPFVSSDYQECVRVMREMADSYADDLRDELEDEGYAVEVDHGYASSSNLAAAAVTDDRPHSLGRYFAVELCEDDEDEEYERSARKMVEDGATLIDLTVETSRGPVTFEKVGEPITEQAAPHVVVSRYVDSHYQGVYLTRLVEKRESGSELWESFLHSPDGPRILTLLSPDGGCEDVTRNRLWS